MPVPPVGPLKGTGRASFLVVLYRGLSSLLFSLSSSFFFPSPLDRHFFCASSFSLPHATHDYAHGPSSRARSQDHSGAAECAKVEQERVSKERPSDALSGYSTDEYARCVVRYVHILKNSSHSKIYCFFFSIFNYLM